MNDGTLGPMLRELGARNEGIDRDEPPEGRKLGVLIRGPMPRLLIDGPRDPEEPDREMADPPLELPREKLPRDFPPSRGGAAKLHEAASTNRTQTAGDIHRHERLTSRDQRRMAKSPALEGNRKRGSAIF